MWLSHRWISPVLTPLRRKVGSCHIKRVQKQLRDTLIRRVASPVERILNSLIHQRIDPPLDVAQRSLWPWGLGACDKCSQIYDGLAWSGPNVRWNWKSGQEPDGPAFERNPNETPKTQFVKKGWEHSFCCSFWGQEHECGGGRYLGNNSLTPWSWPVWANRPDSWVHKCHGASKGPEQHPCTLWTSSAPRPGQREEPCTGKPFLQKQTEGTSCASGWPECDNRHPSGPTVTNQSPTWI